MITTLDFILLVIEYVSYLLEPLYEKLTKRLNFRRKDKGLYCHESPWLLRNHKVGRTLAGLSLEMRSLHRMIQENESNVNRKSMIRLTKQMIEARWPWAIIHAAPSEPVDRQFNWLDYDLCLIEDWDFPMLKPNFDFLSKPANNDEKNLDTAGTDTYNEKLKMRIIYSSSVERKALLEIDNDTNCEQNFTDKGGNSETKCVSSMEPLILRIKWLTIDEFHLLEKRAELVFYYTQIHPELPVLHQVIAKLLESAGLIEPVVYSSHRCPPTDQSNNSHGKASKGANHQQQSPLLSRYKLTLMIVAYLNSEQALSVKKSPLSESRNSLALHLREFLLAYSNQNENEKHGAFIVAPNSSGQLELFRQQQIDDDAKSTSHPVRSSDLSASNYNNGQLVIVLDPADAHKGTESSSNHNSTEKISSTNMNKDLESSGSMVEFFNQLVNHLSENNDNSIRSQNSTTTNETNSYCNSTKTLLESLFILSIEYAQQNYRTLSADEMKPAELELRSVAKAANFTPLGRQQNSSRRSLAGLNLNWRKITRNIFYLAVFFLVRYYLHSYLVRLRNDLKEQSREDFIQVKHFLFGGISLQQQQDDAYYASLNRRYVSDNDESPKSKQRAWNRGATSSSFNQKQEMEFDELFDDLLEKDTKSKSHSKHKSGSNDDEITPNGANTDEDDWDNEDEDEDDDEDDIFGNLFSALLTGKAPAGMMSGGGLDLAKLMSGDGAGLAGLSEMLGGKNLEGMDMSQMQGLLKNLMANGGQDLDPSKLVENLDNSKSEEATRVESETPTETPDFQKDEL